MFRKVKLILVLLFIPSIELFAKDNKSRLSLGGGIYNFMKHGSEGFNQSSIAYNIELFSGRKMGNFVRPFISLYLNIYDPYLLIASLNEPIKTILFFHKTG